MYGAGHWVLPGAARCGSSPAPTFSQTNGVGTVTFDETGPLPTGIMFSSSMLSGTPTQTGSFPITMTATDQNGCTGSRSYILTIACTSSTITVGPASIPSGTINTPYAGATFAASGGTAPFTPLESGALPAAVTFHNWNRPRAPTLASGFPHPVVAFQTQPTAGPTRF